jgi:hypothetical protein
MKKICGVLFIGVLLAGFVGCSNSECKKLKDCQEKLSECVNGNQSNLVSDDSGMVEETEPAELNQGWITSVPKEGIVEDDISNLVGGTVIFIPVSNYLMYGVKNKAYNFCTEFISGSDGIPFVESRMNLRIGQNQSGSLRLLKKYSYDLGEDSNNPFAVQWITKGGQLYFRVGNLEDTTITTNNNYALEGNAQTSVKITDMFPIAPGTSTNALIGAQDTRAGIYDEKKIVSYGVSGIAGLAYVPSSTGTDEGSLYNVPISKDLKSYETNGNPIGVADWICK